MTVLKERVIRKLQGHSGCDVFLCKNAKSLSVVKMSSGEGYNERLIKQMIKQKAFEHDLLKKPNVLDEGFCSEDGPKKFWFEMEFISGLPFHQYVDNSSRQNSLDKINSVARFIDTNNFLDEDIESDIIEKVNSFPNFRDKDINYLLDYIVDFDWKKIKKSYSHGDLTFENILMTKDEIYLIDFLDSFASSRCIDYSKIMQDTVFGWSWRHKKSSPFVTLMMMNDALTDRLTVEEIEACKKMLTLNIIRVLPYSKDKEFVLNCLGYARKEFANG